MKITLTPETDAEKRSMAESETVMKNVPRMVLIMGGSDTWFSLTGAPFDMYRADVARMANQLEKMEMVGVVKQAFKQMAVESQIANGPAAQIGNRIIQTGRG